MERPSKVARTEEVQIEKLAKDWLDIDFVPQTIEVVKALLDADDKPGLEKLLRKRLAFGTAGLRGPMGAGYSRMNAVTVVQCTQGIVAYLEKTNDLNKLKSDGVVIGYDHRDDMAGTNSEMMACAAAAVCVHRGIKVYLYPTIVCTPMVPFCVKYKGCAAGMMVTASHNPKADNGYKMYGANGAQLCEPHDVAIADLILENLAPWTDYAKASAEVRSSSLCVDCLEEIKTAYFKEMVNTLCFQPEKNSKSDLKIVYTAMHGVGTPFTTKAFEVFGHKPLIMVPQQNSPDPSFPTVAYPNPEEGKGALSLSFAAAAAAGAPLVLANDPDADRLAVAELLDGQWRMFSGNEIGMLLAHWLMSKEKEKGTAVDKLAVVASTVSSKMTRALAHKEGMCFEETLTGFKWICNKKADLQQEGYKVVLAFEESIGFCCGDLVMFVSCLCQSVVCECVSV
jgi:phosphomannomutase